ncbi:MAG: hypothetical protein LBB45_08620 [Methanobrevibacter sp.]|jgi:hypothetical protein|nr:hypothetical protein [Candidatus Methanovirga basalitermitum]
MKYKEIISIITLIAILSVCFITATTPAYVHIVDVTDTPNGLVIDANITTDEGGSILIPNGDGINPKYTTVSSVGQPSSAGYSYTTNGTVQFLIANCHSYNYESITVSFDDYSGKYTPVPDTWTNDMKPGPDINVSSVTDNDTVIIIYQVDTPIYVNNTDEGSTNTTYNVTVTNNDNETNTTVTGNITFNGDEITNDTTKLNSNGTKNGTTNMTLPPGNYTGKFIVNGNVTDHRKGNSAEFNFTIKDSSTKHFTPNPPNNPNLIPLQRTGLPIYSLILALLSILLFPSRRK